MNTANATATVKKTPVAKTIPKKIMGYLKFAHFIINNPQSDIIHTLFLDQSIEEIVALVNDVVVNGEQDKVIIDLRKQFIHASNPPKPKAKPRSKKTNADVIVDDLVTLAREPEPKNPEPKKIPVKRSTKKIPVADPVPVTNHLEEDIFVNDPVVNAPVEQVDRIDQHVNDHVVNDPVDQVVNDPVDHVVNDQVVNDPVDQVVKDPVVAPKIKKGKKPVNVPENEMDPEVPVPEEKIVPETKKKNKKPVVEKPVI